MRHKKPANRNNPPRFLERKRTLKGGGVWVGYYYNGRDENGERKEVPLGTDRDEALQAWAKLERKSVPAVTKTVADLLNRYERDVVPSKQPKTQKENIKCIKKLLNAFGTAPLESVSSQMIAQYRDARTAPVRANREISLLSHAFNMAREWGIYNRDNPVRGVRRNKEAPRDVYVTDEVWQEVYQQAPLDLRTAMDIAYLTGQRPADVRKMRWADVDDDFLTVGQGKTSTKLRIRLHIEGLRTGLGRLIDSLERTTPFLIATDEGNQFTEMSLRWRFEPARKRAAEEATKRGDKDLAAAIAAFQFRDIRPKAASEIVSLEDASDLLGHTTQGMTKRVYRRVGKVVNPVN